MVAGEARGTKGRTGPNVMEWASFGATKRRESPREKIADGRPTLIFQLRHQTGNRARDLGFR